MSAPEPEAPRRSWRSHPLLKRLPILIVAAAGFWLWDATKVPERELVWHLEGPGWARVQSLELQVLGEGEELLKREERFFPEGAPGDVVVPLALRPGSYRVRFFLRTPEGTLPARVESLTLGDEPRVEHSLWLAARR